MLSLGSSGWISAMNSRRLNDAKESSRFRDDELFGDAFGVRDKVWFCHRPDLEIH